MAITAFTPGDLDMLRKEIDAALAEISSKHGIKLEIGGMRYERDGSSFSTKLTGKTSAATIKAARQLGVPEDIVGKEFDYNGKTYEVTGLNPRKTKHPIIGNLKGTDKSYTFSKELVLAGLK